MGLGFHLKSTVWMFIIFSGSALLCLQLEPVAELCTLGLDTLQGGHKLEGGISAGSLPQSLIKHRPGTASNHIPAAQQTQILPNLSALLLICPRPSTALSKCSKFCALLLIKHNKRNSAYYPANTAESCLFLQSTFQFAFKRDWFCS